MNNKESVAQSVQDTAQNHTQLADNKDNRHNRDINSKTVFGNPVLCAQFLRDNFDIPALKDICPEDIEDVSERYRPYLGTEFDSDSVKKIRILGIGKTDEPAFLISLIEHKSLVDYDVSMQLLRYMMCIWTEYRREMEAKKSGSTQRKSFRYPIIIPIVYYEGKEPWTADIHLRDRIRQNPGLKDWIPDFRYEVVRVHDYSNQELLDRGDEMSLIMLINKIQNEADLEKFIRIPPEKVNRIVRNSPEHVIDVMVSVMESLCFKIDASSEERKQCVRKVRTREMGYLFENMEKISIQEMRRKTEEQRQRAEEQQQRAEEQQQRAEEQQQRAEEQQQRAEEQQQRADEQQQRADEQQQRADEQQQRAEKEHQRAEEQRLRADALEEKLRLAEETIRLLKQKEQ